jgi:hypothetical protein
MSSNSQHRSPCSVSRAELDDQLVNVRSGDLRQPLKTVLRQLRVMPTHQPQRPLELVTHHRRLPAALPSAATLNPATKPKIV